MKKQAVKQPLKNNLNNFSPNGLDLKKLKLGVLLTLSVMLFCVSGCSLFSSNALDPSGSPSASSSSSAFVDPASPRGQALLVYNEAWQTVKYEYVDDGFNGQDWARWEHRYDKVIQEPEDAYVAIQTMLASLNDDYTRFLPPRDMSEQTMQIDAKVYGVGIQITVKDKKLTVVSTLDETPAAAAGLEPKDVISHIEGESTAGMTVRDAADRIRGKLGSLVHLTLQRGDSSFDVSVRRAEIKIQTVFIRDLDQKEIGYVRLNSFISENATLEMQDAINKMADKKALILDLRGNYGGLFRNAIDISDMFLSEGNIVLIKGRTAGRNREESARRGNEVDMPLVVLIDGGSASASEIVSGALKDNKRATLIGTRTFGKGLVQKINPLEDGSGINITISKYLTPSGLDIHHKGIEPNIEVPYTRKDLKSNEDPQLDAAIDYLIKKAHLSPRKTLSKAS